MEDSRVASMVFGLVLLSAMASIAVLFLSPSTTGQVSIYQRVPFYGGVENQPDPHTQYIQFDENLCGRVQRQFTDFLSWMDKQCERLNPGRQKRKGDCRYQAELDAQTLCRAAPAFGNVMPPPYYVP